MVYFVCNNCQETLKGKAVEAHSWRCGTASLCCVDCSRDFDVHTYKQHTTCISEEQKYQGALYKAKDKKKVDPQELWTQQVAAAAGKPSKHKALLEQLTYYTNVPRKFKPFVNFAKNSIGVRQENILQEVFDLISKEGPAKPAPAAAAAPVEDKEEEEAKKEEEAPKKTDKASEGSSKLAGTKRKRADSSDDDSEEEAKAAAPPPAKKGKFDFKAAITAHLAGAGGKAKLKRLRKAVVEAAVSAGGVSEDKATSKFEKKMKKMLAKEKLVTDDAGKFVAAVA